MSTEQEVAKHYTRGGLERAILDALETSGKNIDKLVPADLAAADEFHFGWRAATEELGNSLGLKAGETVLDIGSGIGGPARYFADVHGCQVTGLDLTEEFVKVAQALTKRCGLADRVSFKRGSALAMPFHDGAFDAATLVHVGMNIADKATLFSETRRVLKPGGRFGVYDIMQITTDPILYPEPWADTIETSFMETPETYRRLLQSAGFKIELERSQRDLTLRLASEMREKAAVHGAPALGLHIVMGPATPERLGNAMKTLQAGTFAPIEMIARAV